ncbi:MAG: peptide chain release factor N(5)-glutamine methyltransferase [Rhodocyclales bacterium]|nr:peptide chain release factor N(5)-glutamine methyltransferase [Rhodocyclales bacterium]
MTPVMSQNRLAAVITTAREKLPTSEARLLLGHVLQKPLAWLLAHDDEVLDEAGLSAFKTLVTRRAAGEPVAYLLGYREFFGREFLTTPATLIPRPETELLVERVIEKVSLKVGDGETAIKHKSRRILDLGTGTGCIAITLALECPGVLVCAIDASKAALDVAQSNAQRLNANVRFLHSDWFAAVGGEKFDLIVGNPPYIAAEDAHLLQGDLRFEPPAALASGADGLDAMRHIIAAAPAHLSAHGQLWLEHGHDQADAVRALLAAAGFTAIAQHRDLAGIVRVSGGVRGAMT